MPKLTAEQAHARALSHVAGGRFDEAEKLLLISVLRAPQVSEYRATLAEVRRLGVEAAEAAAGPMVEIEDGDEGDDGEDDWSETPSSGSEASEEAEVDDDLLDGALDDDVIDGALDDVLDEAPTESLSEPLRAVSPPQSTPTPAPSTGDGGAAEDSGGPAQASSAPSANQAARARRTVLGDPTADIELESMLSRRELAQAEDKLRARLDTAPSESVPHRMLAMVLRARGEHLAEARFHADRAVRLDATDLEAHVLRVRLAEERRDGDTVDMVKQAAIEAASGDHARLRAAGRRLNKRIPSAEKAKAAAKAKARKSSPSLRLPAGGRAIVLAACLLLSGGVVVHRYLSTRDQPVEIGTFEADLGVIEANLLHPGNELTVVIPTERWDTWSPGGSAQALQRVWAGASSIPGVEVAFVQSETGVLLGAVREDQVYVR